MNYEYISPSELKEVLSDEKTSVIDVRDEDFNVNGCEQHPAL